jgi:DNA-binding NarL/FixJ family response regulator
MSYNPQLGDGPRDAPALPVRVYVIADDALAGDGLRATLRDDTRMACVTGVAEADVVVWDLGAGAGGATLPDSSHPQLEGVRAGRQALVMLVADESAAAHALRVGAMAVLRRRGHGPSLTAAIMAVRFGMCVLDTAFAEHYLELPKPSAAEISPREREREREPIDSLTARERQVLEALALGLSNRAIARRLEVSVHTVKFHMNGIFAKLQVDSRAGAVAKALRNGLILI